MIVEKTSIELIKPYEKNAKSHPLKQIKKIEKSILEYGFRIPIIIDDRNVIVAGHGRLLAAKRIGLDVVPTIRVVDLTKEQIKAFRMMDNKSGESDWILENLIDELHELLEIGFDLELTGFDGVEIEGLFKIKEGATDPDDVPDLPAEPMTRPGDMWQMGGRHCLICGDCREERTMNKLMKGASKAEMVFTDPPYNVNYGSTMKNKDRIILNDHFKTNEEFYQFLYGAIGAFKPFVSGDVYICMSSSELHTLQKAFMDCGGHWADYIIWVKNHFTIGHANYQRQYETILYGWFEKSSHYWSGIRNLSDVLGVGELQYDIDGVPLVRVESCKIESNFWPYPKPQKSKEHPTMKPVALVVRAIQNSTKRNDTVLDTFGGSGSTLIGCEQTGRKCRIAELDPKYCDVIVTRWEKFTGQKAKHIKMKDR